MSAPARTAEMVLHELVQTVVDAADLARQRRNVLAHRDELVAEAFALGLYGTDVSKVSGLSLTRAYQIRDDKRG